MWFLILSTALFFLGDLAEAVMQRFVLSFHQLNSTILKKFIPKIQPISEERNDSETGWMQPQSRVGCHFYLVQFHDDE